MERLPIDSTCIVIGAGPAGLGTAAMLRRRGVPVLVVDRADRVASSWHARYDGFRLNTSSWFSYLPGAHYPRAAGQWPSRDAIVSYYESYAQKHDLDIQLKTEVLRLERENELWLLRTSQGNVRSRHVVIATGRDHTPVIPQWPGRNDYRGELIHSAQYKNAAPYRDQKVLVVGPGNSGFEIADQLSRGGAAKTWLSIRTPPHVIHRNVGPLPTDAFAVLGRRLPVVVIDVAGEVIRKLRIGDLSEYGLDAPPDGIYTRIRRTGMIPTVDGSFLDAIKTKRVEIVAAVDALHPSYVALTDGSIVEPDAVIAATGYRTNLEPLVGHLGVLDDEGFPLVHDRITHPNAPRLHFIGFTFPLSGNLRQHRFDARKIARAMTSDS
jgi:cation diffusion facilitator CzcD-associated flavoprotein CzcO